MTGFKARLLGVSAAVGLGLMALDPADAAPLPGEKNGLVVPYYVFPGTPDLDRLVGQINLHPGVPVIVVLNQANGPGPYSSGVANQIAALKATGATVVGYVYTSFGTRPSADVEADVLAWNAVYSATPLDGIFLDEMAHDPGPGNSTVDLYAGYYRFINQHNYRITVGNPGVHQDGIWYSPDVTADIIVTSENTSWPVPASLTAAWNTEGVLVHDLPVFDGVTYSGVAAKARWIYATDGSGGNPWGGLPTYLESEFAAAEATAGNRPDSCTASTCPGSPLPAGFETVSGQVIKDSGGNTVRWACAQFRGGPGEPGVLKAIRAGGFNCVRISWRDAFLMGTNPGFSDCSFMMAGLVTCVNDARAAGLKVILDHHGNEFPSDPASACWGQQQNGLWYDKGGVTDNTDGCGDPGTVDYPTFKANWLAIASQFAGNDTVIGLDLHNEPFTYGSNTSSQLCWGCGSTADILGMFDDVGAGIHAVNPGAIVIAEGPLNNSTLLSGAPYPLTSGSIGDLSKVATSPVTGLPADKIAYSVHDYPTSVSAVVPDSGAGADTARTVAWGTVASWIGELGCTCEPGNAAENAWASGLVSYVNGKNLGTNWFSWAYSPGENPDGLLNSDQVTLAVNQQNYWQQMLYHAPGPSPGTSKPVTVIILGQGEPER